MFTIYWYFFSYRNELTDKKLKESSESTNQIGLIVGIVIPLLIVFLVGLLFVVWFLLKRKAEADRRKCDESERLRMTSEKVVESHDVPQS